MIWTYPANIYLTKCSRCRKELKPGEGWVVNRNKGYEIICSKECLHRQNNLTIEARIYTPQVSGLCKLEPYWRKAEFAVIEKMKEIFAGSYHWKKIRSRDYSITRGQNLSESGEVYCFVTATVRNVTSKNKREIIFNVQ